MNQFLIIKNGVEFIQKNIYFCNVKGQLLFIGKLALIWLILFHFQRMLFVFHFFSDFSGNYGELLALPFYSIRLDLSAIGYLSGIPMILSVLTFFTQSERGIRIINRIISIYFWIMLVAIALMMSGEIVTYIEWKTKLSSKIFMHFGTPSEVFRTASSSYTIWYIFYFIIQIIAGFFIYVKLFKQNKILLKIQSISKRILFAFTYLVGSALILTLFIRGGWQQIPISSTDAYFSQKQIVNDVSVNPEWSFIRTCYAYFKVDLSSYYRNIDPIEAEKIRASLYQNEGVDTVRIFNQEKPNIVLVTLEGWSGQIIEPLGGEEGITPNFDALCDEGVLFNQIYSTGGTSETGHSSIISGYPTIAGISISTESAKCRALPSLNQSFEALGYNSFYTFGGSLSYGNIGGYLTDVGFDRLVDENDLDLEPTGKLGIHDEAMFPYFLSEIRTAQRPFFYGLFTQSTHSPYDMPAEPFPGYNNDGYVTSMHYADEHLGKFVAGIRELPDFDNTIVIFIADHGRANLFNQNTYDEKYFHIPLLIWGGAIDSVYKGFKVNRIGSQADLAKTLLTQLDMDASEFHWSKNLLDPTTQEWAICTSTLSYGWKDKKGYTVYHMVDGRLVASPYEKQSDINLALKNCRSILECMYREFQEL